MCAVGLGRWAYEESLGSVVHKYDDSVYYSVFTATKAGSLRSPSLTSPRQTLKKQKVFTVKLCEQTVGLLVRPGVSTSPRDYMQSQKSVTAAAPHPKGTNFLSGDQPEDQCPG
ncbi:hypothetical protein Q8A73_006162 [Channa argus]|nr:hypothetical protein Q8A73_006162 [Channa argus]